MKKLQFFAFVLVTIASIFPCIAANDLPRFENYSIVSEAVKKSAKLQISDAQSRRYAFQLREAAKSNPDFAGHYILASWGCGASCIMAAAIDAKTGKIAKLPFTVSNWPLDITEPLEYKIDSSLLIVRGSRNEKESGTYYYQFDGQHFNLVREIQNQFP